MTEISDKVARTGSVQKLFTDNPEIKTWADKLVSAHRTVHGQRVSGSRIESPNRHRMETLANRTANNITDAASVTEMLPDVELARQVLNSSIISPQDMVSTDINFVVDNDKLPAEIVACKEVLDIFFSEEYSVEELLPKAIDEALWVSGAHVLAVIPETGLDSIINHGGVS